MLLPTTHQSQSYLKGLKEGEEKEPHTVQSRGRESQDPEAHTHIDLWARGGPIVMIDIQAAVHKHPADSEREERGTNASAKHCSS